MANSILLVSFAERYRREGRPLFDATPAPVTSPLTVVTGATGGIGRFIALGLAREGYHLVLICRNRVRAEATRAWIADATPHSTIDLRIADLSLVSATIEIGGNSISAKSTECGIVPAIDQIVTADCWHSRLRAAVPQSTVVESLLSIGHCAKGTSRRASRGEFICTDLSASRRSRQRFRPPALAWCLLEVYTL